MGKAVGGSSSSGTFTVNEAREYCGLPRKDDPEADKLIIWQYRGNSANREKPKPKTDEGDDGED